VCLLAALLGSAAIAAAEPPSAPRPLTADQFVAIDPGTFAASRTVGLDPAADSAARLGDAHPVIADFGGAPTLEAAEAEARFGPPDAAGATSNAKSLTKRPPITHRVNGIATWYCRTGVSGCHYAHSSGLYAAAGAEIRTGDWRGREVRVCGGGNCVWVTLIDWCACAGNRIIDLYSDAYRRLDPLSSGTLSVTVGW
jgi:hypothetical protein